MTKNKRKKDNVFDYDESSKYIAKTCSNVKTDQIFITEDKLKNILTEYQAKEKETKKWQTSASYVITLSLILATTKEYNDILNTDTKTIIIFSLIIASVLTVRNLFYCWKYRQQIGIDKLIKTIKNEMDESDDSKKRKNIEPLDKLISQNDMQRIFYKYTLK